MSINQLIQNKIKHLKKELNKRELSFGEIIFNNGQCQVLSQSALLFELIIMSDSEDQSTEFSLLIEDQGIIPKAGNKRSRWDRYTYACLLQVNSELKLPDQKAHIEHKKYTRKGMVNRVLQERRLKSETEKYKIKWAENIYGDHILTNENGQEYIVFLRDFEKETGYSNSADSKINKLGTTKHIMFAFNELNTRPSLYRRLRKSCQFIEVYCDPLNDYRISWFYPHELALDDKLLITSFFGSSNYIEDQKARTLLSFIEAAGQNENIRIRQEVLDKIESLFELEMMEKLQVSYVPDYSRISANLFDYQKEGVEFSLFKKTSIIADEMGLGKTLEAISVAILKKEIFDFKKTLVVCPASVKEQWKDEIENFSDEKALVISGSFVERLEQYQKSNQYFFIINYETILRDYKTLAKMGFDFLILDEAQRAKNFETKTALYLKRIPARHKLVITGTPIENKLIDIFSIMSVLDPQFLGPLWEFSYKHCLFDSEKPNKINGYYNLKELNKKLSEVLIRREKRKVLDQLPNIRQINIPVNLGPYQQDLHASFARGIATITRKKYLTPFDVQKLQMLLANMRMVCDSSYLIDEESHESPKLKELEYILLEKLDVLNRDVKIIIFSEWVKVHKIVGQMLRKNKIGFVELNGNVPVKARGALIKKFEENPDSKIFLSTEAGGSGLNLQVADTVINFELPWNPAKKNQRIGRIDRIGQKSKKLTVINFISRGSIEEKIATGLIVKQNLFDGVLGPDADINFVDFSSKGRPQFIQQLEEFVTEIELTPYDKIDTHEDFKEPVGEAISKENLQNTIDWNESIDEDLPEPETAIKNKELEEVMNTGMQFLSGLFKMATGKEMTGKEQKIEIDEKTGEIVMRFKI